MRSDLYLFPALLTLSACGALVDGTWQGVPLLTFEGHVFIQDGPALDNLDVSKLKPTVRFIGPEGEAGGTGAFEVSQTSTSTSFPARYTIHVFQPPPEAAKFVTPWDPDGPQIAVALPLLYLDEDGDDIWDAETELIVGGSVDVVGVWSDATVEAVAWDTATLDTDPLQDTDADLTLDTAWDTGMPILGSVIPFSKGYQHLSADIRWCGDRAHAPTSRFELLPPAFDRVDMFVGRPFRELTSWGCFNQP